MKILVVRNDKLGDFMLAYPSFALLKSSMPDACVAALVPEYTREMAEACPWIDEVVVDPPERDGVKGVTALRSVLKKGRFDAVIALHSTARTAVAAWLAGIPCRIAPASKAYQAFYNLRVVQRRSRSIKPESEYNTDLVEAFLHRQEVPVAMAPSPPYLRFDHLEVQRLKESFVGDRRISPESKLIFVHVGSGGSSSNLSLEQYATLAASLRSSGGHTIVVVSGPSEVSLAERFADTLGDVEHALYVSDHGLLRFAQHVQFADVFIGGSTGTLHIAGALDTPTAGFYTNERSATPLRWQTLNSPGRRLAFAPPKGSDGDMAAIDLECAAREISEAYLL